MSLHSPFSTAPAGRDSSAFAYRHLRGLIGQTLAYFAEHETDNLRRVREHLLDLADARPSQARMQNLRSASILLHQHAEVFNRAFQSALQTAMDQELQALLPMAAHSVRSDRPPVDALDGMALSLVDMGEVERILLVDRVAQRFNAHYDASVGPLSLRLSVLLQQVAPIGNPFRPEVFVRAFLNAWEHCGFDDQATQELMLGLEPQHSTDLAPLYADLNATLINAGIEARVVHRIRRSQGGGSGHVPLAASSAQAPLSAGDHTRDSGRARLDPAQSMPSSPPWQALVPVGRQFAAQARQFLRRLGLGAPTAGAAPEPHERLVWLEADDGDRARSLLAPADPDFMGYLGGLQVGAVATSPTLAQAGPDPGEQNVLRQMRDRDEVRRAPELDRGTVDALAEVFDFVFADQAIPLQMKYVIGRLQIPVLKAAMIDRDFFLANDHPARRLVDTLASASIAWAPEKGEDDPLYQRIEHTVMRVLNEFEDDLGLFSDLLQEFTEFLFETEQQVQVRIEPAASDERVGESYEQALAHADEIVDARIRALPHQLRLVPFLTPFLTNPWREVLARAWLRVQDQPVQWDNALSTMEQLIWSTQPKVQAEDRRQLVAVLPDLVRSLNAGLDDIEWSGEARATFTRRLIATHMLAIRMTQPTVTDTQSAQQEETASNEAMRVLDQRRAAKLAGSVDDFDLVAQGFTRGLWFDFKGDADTKHRCRLSWISPMRTRFLFTNRDGFDAFVRSEREVAALLRRGELGVIDHEPIVSRALERILSNADAEQAVG